uniref:ADP-ribosyl cyclase/cyclic ADP-ribose hydrolase n=1 Tax=Cyprinodon variegatus TaxID=28743 RepID=A0A3Q2FDB4_CYPVA
MTPSSFLLFLLQLCCLQMMLVSIPTCMLPGNVVKNTYNKLHSLVGSWIPGWGSLIVIGSLQCQEWTSLVLYECLREAGNIFAEYDLPEGKDGFMWSGRNFDNYLMLQERLVVDHQCLNSTKASRALSPYFSNITAAVQQQDDSACGWEILRSDLLRVLRRVLHKDRLCLNWTRAH